MPAHSLDARRIRHLLALSLLTVGAATFLSACGGRADAQGGPPPAMPVSVSPAVQRTVTDTETFSGRIEAAEFVELRPRVAGTVDKVHFADGATVARGQLLFTIDPRPFEAEVARATRQLGVVGWSIGGGDAVRLTTGSALAERHGLERGLHHVLGPAEGKGEQRKAFMKECLSAKPEKSAAGASQQNKMKTCNKDAKAKNLAGDERKKFMKECLSN